ncbi:MAG TPA: succinate dehydrogenase, cytochrome b556 subunit [Oceanospirillaceae bacterium]|nr:succinate dehydrogenase, cytochrome b556 subunit [Oceanospirillaceae bacterium]
MSKNRPVNLDLRTIKQPLPAIVSISHRITGVMLFIGLIFMFILFDMSLSGAEGFASAETIMQENFLAKFIAWGLLVSLSFHLFAGLKHLVQDFGYGEELSSANVAAKVVIVATVVTALLAGYWVW